LLRDFQELRKIGALAAFALSDKVQNGRIRLLKFDARPTALDESSRALHGLIRLFAVAAGKPLEEQFASLQPNGESESPRFEMIVTPGLCEGTRVADIFRALETAWGTKARVRCKYHDRERTVEPYAAVVRSGRYYLLGRELDARGSWKYFALDQIASSIGRAGSFTPRAIPETYCALDALGWIKGGNIETVSVWISKTIASSATSRLWQREQKVKQLGDGSATMTFEVGDFDEIICLSLGFGADARVVSPPEAITRAKAIVAEAMAGYDATAKTAPERRLRKSTNVASDSPA
jgi:predicted DNA-binding transcriptional regulator YafY